MVFAKLRWASCEKGQKIKVVLNLGGALRALVLGLRSPRDELLVSGTVLIFQISRIRTYTDAHLVGPSTARVHRRYLESLTPTVIAMR